MLLNMYLKKLPRDHSFDVVAYKEPECLKAVVAWPWHYSNRPDKRYKRVTFNCYEWNIVWVDD